MIGKIVLAVLLTSSLGCAMMIGVSSPKEVTVEDGETVVAYEVTGLSIAVGASGVGGNVEGGNVSGSFVDLVTGVIEAAGRIIGGFFTGLGGIGAAITPAG